MILQSHPWVYIWKKKRYNSKRYMHPHVYINTTYNSEDMEAT